MVENKEYSPTPTEWDELVLLWNRSRAIFANALSKGIASRLAWTTKSFVQNHPDASHREVYAWLERNLEIAKDSVPVASRLPEIGWHDAPTAVHRMRRSTPNGHLTTPAGDPTGDPDPTEKPPVATGPGVHRQG